MDAQSLLAGFATAFTQDRRLFSLHFTDASLDTELLPHAVSGEEWVSATFHIDVECLASDVHHELKAFIGLGVDIAIHGGDGSDRVIAGIVTGAQQLGSEGGFACYGLTIEPAFATLRLRRNSRVFQDKSAVDIVGLILDEHIAANPVFAQCFRHRAELTQTVPPRSYCQQYRETDLAFIERLLREEGISYRFDFDHGDGETGLHTLVLFDRGSDIAPALQNTVRFHRADATEADDTLTDWHAHRQIRSGAVSLASFDYKGVFTQQGEDQTAIDHGDYGNGLGSSLQDYDPQSLYYAANNSELNRYATLRQQASDLAAKCFRGGGVVRGLGAGQWFTLEQHPAHEDDGAADRQFVVLRHAFQARNNLPGDFDTRMANALPEAGYRNDFDAVRKTVPVVPAYSHTDHAKPTARGAQTATVVGPAGEEIFTDALGRIKVQFHWPRPQDHDIGKHGAGASRDDFSSCWVRVAMPSAGAQWGHQFIPRIGQEVLVDFIEGDIDRPVVVRTLHNGQQTPPTFQGAGSLPANRTLSGIKTHEHKGARHNEIVFDDTAGEVRATLSTEHGKTQLHQGYLIHPRSAGRGTPRGEGFELRTDNAGAVRAAQGLLITTQPRPNATGEQLDRDAPLSQLQAAQNLAKQLGDTAKGQTANAPALDPALDTDHLKDKKPHIVLHGHAGAAIATPLSAAITTGKHLDQVAQRDTHQTAGRRWIHNVGESISLFVANADEKLKSAIKLIAAKGDVLMQAQSNDVEITADKKITLTACKENLTATAGNEFLLQSGGGYIRVSGGNVEIHCPGTLSMKASSFVHQAGGSGSAGVPQMPSASIAPIAGNDFSGLLKRYANAATLGAAFPEHLTAADEKSIGSKIRSLYGGNDTIQNQADIAAYNEKPSALGTTHGKIFDTSEIAIGALGLVEAGLGVPKLAAAVKNLGFARKAVNPSSLDEARAMLQARREKIASEGYQPKYNDAELHELAQHGDVGKERFHVRFMEERYLQDSDTPDIALSGKLGTTMEGASGKGAKYWSTTFDQLEDADTDPKLISEKLGLDYKPDASYTMVIVDTEKAAPLTGVKSVPATFEKVGEFAHTEFPQDFPLSFTKQAMTPEFQAKYAEHYRAAVENGGLPNAWSKDVDKFGEYLKTTSMPMSELEIMKTRMSMHDVIGNNQDYVGNGLTKDIIGDSPNNYGAVETLNFERNEVTLKQLNDAGAISIITGLKPL